MHWKACRTIDVCVACNDVGRGYAIAVLYKLNVSFRLRL